MIRAKRSVISTTVSAMKLILLRNYHKRLHLRLKLQPLTLKSNENERNYNRIYTKTVSSL
ncbi:hypothetical protein Hanom_Chr04g00347961 [Helianthus anomalus]